MDDRRVVLCRSMKNETTSKPGGPCLSPTSQAHTPSSVTAHLEQSLYALFQGLFVGLAPQASHAHQHLEELCGGDTSGLQLGEAWE